IQGVVQIIQWKNMMILPWRIPKRLVWKVCQIYTVISEGQKPSAFAISYVTIAVYRTAVDALLIKFRHLRLLIKDATHTT
ncbi:hypothetical protein DRN77_03080, partial [Methanosarcinales archaeon]